MKWFTKDEVRAAVAANNTEWLAEVLDHLGYENKGSRTVLIDVGYTFMTTAFATAAIAAQNDTLDHSIIELLIERTLPAINIFDFAAGFLFARGVVGADCDLIPDNIKKSLKDNEYNEVLGATIQKMGGDEIDALLSFLVDEIETINISFFYPIIRHIYDEKLLSDAQLVMIIGFSLDEPKSSDMISELGKLLSGGLF